MTQPTQKQIANGCKHFNGIQNDKCEAGVTYNIFTGDDWLPCRTHHVTGKLNGHCPLFEFETVAEIEAHEKASNEVAKWINLLAEGKCPDCGANVEPRRQVGRCVYGACGHRLFQGKL